MKAVFRCFTVAVLACAAATPVLAHHSYSLFLMDKTLVFKGKVVEYRWVNPHAHIIIKVDPGAGIDPESVGTWDIEGASTNIMGRQGWTKATFKAGDAVEFAGHPLKDGSKGAALFYAVLPDGRRLYMDISRPAQATQ